MHGYVFTMQYPCGWVSPFGHCRINACCQLPDTFRRLPRPSSPLTAKASTVCAYSLDHITPSRLGISVQHFAYLPQRHVWFDRTKTLVTSQVFKEHATDFNVRTSSIRKCAQCHPRVICFRAIAREELVELTGIEPVTPCLQSRCSPS